MRPGPRLTLAVADHDLNHLLIHGQVRSKDLTLEIVWEEDLFVKETITSPGA